MSTYTPIASQTLGSAATSVTFSSIPQGYTDLVLVMDAKSSGNCGVFLRFNGDSSSLYSHTQLWGNGSTAGSDRGGSVPQISLTSLDSSGPYLSICNLQNYSNSTTYKTTLSRASSGDNNRVWARVGLYRSTAAITSILIYADSSETFSTGSTFSIYGIQVGDKAQKAQGGNIVTSDGTYMYHAFTSSGAFIPNAALTADILCVAGGGGGGYNTGGGGGAGGYRLLSSQSLTAISYPVIVGAGGAGGPTSTQTGINGSNSLFGSISSTGGGGGAGSQTTVDGLGGNSGGSGGGASRGAIASRSGGAGNAGSYSPVEGYAGGNNGSGPAGGGGGGATAVGANATSNGGAGGAGSNSASSWLSATSLGVSGFVAGGGGGGVYGGGSGGAGGSGGGGVGSADSVNAAGNGVTNTGSGGGGCNNNSVPSGTAGSGGSGLVVIRYAI